MTGSVEGKFRFDVHHHQATFDNRREIIDFVKDYSKSFDINLADEDGNIEIEFDETQI